MVQKHCNTFYGCTCREPVQNTRRICEFKNSKSGVKHAIKYIQASYMMLPLSGNIAQQSAVDNVVFFLHFSKMKWFENGLRKIPVYPRAKYRLNLKVWCFVLTV